LWALPSTAVYPLCLATVIARARLLRDATVGGGRGVLHSANTSQYVVENGMTIFSASLDNSGNLLLTEEEIQNRTKPDHGIAS
jgi:hypothetical protein